MKKKYVSRGGSWFSLASFRRIISRDFFPYSNNNDVLGFRLKLK